MRLLTLSVVLLTLSSGLAIADRHRGGGRGGHDQRGAVRDNRGHGRPIVRDHRQVVVRHQQPARHHQPARHQPAHHDRRVVQRRHVYSHNNRFTFHNGHTVVYQRPVIHHRHYNVRVRPQVIVEQYAQQPGYIWVGGSWSWNGYEWLWQAGYYAPDPQYQTYYDDGSYE